MTEKIIELSNITIIKEKRKILDVDEFSLSKGEAVVLIGPNGAGKSTLLQVLMLLQKFAGGEYLFKGEPVKWKDALTYRRSMAMVFQEALLLDTTVYKNVASGMEIRGFPREQISGRVEKWLSRLGISHLSSRPARRLSGGESQRVSIARALVLEPEVIFLDEPFAALDEPTRNALISEFTDILQDTGISSITVTHNYHEIPALADRVVALEDGRVIQNTSPMEILARPVSLSVANLVGVKNTIPGKIVNFIKQDRVGVQAGPHEIIAQGHVSVGCTSVFVLLRPENVKVMRSPDRELVNNLPGKLKKMLHYGDTITLLVDCGVPIYVTVDNERGGEFNVGSDIWLGFQPEQVHIIENPSTRSNLN